MTRRKRPKLSDQISSPKAVDSQLDGAKVIGGSKIEAWNLQVAEQVVASTWLGDADPDKRKTLIGSALTAMASIAPKDEFEAMIGMQIVALHQATMECTRRAMLPQQTFEARRENLNQATKLSRTFATLVETINKHRGKGQQKVTVEHVHVHSGGQAVVGVVATQGGGASTKTEEQPHAKQIAYAPQPSLWGMHEAGESMHVARDEERPMPDARRPRNRRAEG